jgi:Tfp pilus assembly protein PilN
MKDYLASEPIKSQLAELEVVKKKTQLLQNYQSTFEVIDNYVEGSRLVSTTLLTQIGSTLPKTVTFKSLSITDNEVTIDGTAPDDLPIAELVRNLKKTGWFITVDMGTIAIDKTLGGERLFTLKAVLKGVTAP